MSFTTPLLGYNRGGSGLGVSGIFGIDAPSLPWETIRVIQEITKGGTVAPEPSAIAAFREPAAVVPLSITTGEEVGYVDFSPPVLPVGEDSGVSIWPRWQIPTKRSPPPGVSIPPVDPGTVSGSYVPAPVATEEDFPGGVFPEIDTTPYEVIDPDPPGTEYPTEGEFTQAEEPVAEWVDFIASQAQGLIGSWTGVPAGGQYLPAAGARPPPTINPSVTYTTGGKCVNSATGMPCKRRRRRRLLTESDFNDLMRIATLPNKQNVAVALAKAVGRR